MNVYQNILAELAAEKQAAVDSQIFTYGFTVFVPNKGTHTAQSQLPWPGLTPGKARKSFKVDRDSPHFKVQAITASVMGPVRWTAATGEADQVAKKAVGGSSYYLLPGLGAVPSVAHVSSAEFTMTGTAATDIVKLVGTNGPFFTGQPLNVFAAPAGGALSAPLAEKTVYYMIDVGVNGADYDIKLATTPANAFAGTAIDLTSNSVATCKAQMKSAQAERGVSIRMQDLSKTSRYIIGTDQQFVPMECLFPPAYGTHIAQPFAFDYILEQDHELVMEFRNRDQAGPDLYHVVNIAFHGVKFY